MTNPTPEALEQVREAAQQVIMTLRELYSKSKRFERVSEKQEQTAEELSTLVLGLHNERVVLGERLKVPEVIEILRLVNPSAITILDTSGLSHAEALRDSAAAKLYIAIASTSGVAYLDSSVLPVPVESDLKANPDILALAFQPHGYSYEKFDLAKWQIKKEIQLATKTASADANNSEIAQAEGDGPSTPYTWRYGGKKIGDMRSGAWKLVSYLWGRRSRRADFEEIGRPVFEINECPNINQVGALRRDANNFFRKHQIPWTVKTRAREVFLESRDWSQVAAGNLIETHTADWISLAQ